MDACMLGRRWCDQATGEIEELVRDIPPAVGGEWSHPQARPQL